MNAIRVEKIYKKYHKGSNEVVANNCLSFDVPENKITAFLGPNGAGKSTFIKILAGITPETSGQIDILGHKNIDLLERKNHISAVLENSENAVGFMTLAENCRYFAYLNKKYVFEEEINQILQDWQLIESKNKAFMELSRGQKQRFLVLIAQIKQAPILVLDEPTLGLDITSVEQLKQKIQLLQKSGKTILITSHDIPFIEAIATHVVVIKAGEIRFSGSLTELTSYYKKTSLYHSYLEAVL